MKRVTDLVALLRRGSSDAYKEVEGLQPQLTAEDMLEEMSEIGKVTVHQIDNREGKKWWVTLKLGSRLAGVSGQVDGEENINLTLAVASCYTRLKAIMP